MPALALLMTPHRLQADRVLEHPISQVGEGLLENEMEALIAKKMRWEQMARAKGHSCMEPAYTPATPTPKQIAYIKLLCEQAGKEMKMPQTKLEASGMIDRLKQP